jgi:arylsulfatase
MKQLPAIFCLLGAVCGATHAAENRPARPNVIVILADDLGFSDLGCYGGEIQTLCWSTSGCRAIRIGPWKLVSAKDGPWELYDMTTDRTELNDLAQQQPDRVQTMAKLFDQWRRQGESP